MPCSLCYRCACRDIPLFRPLDQSVCRRPMDPARDFCSGPACSAHSARAVECTGSGSSGDDRLRGLARRLLLERLERRAFGGAVGARRRAEEAGGAELGGARVVEALRTAAVVRAGRGLLLF